MTYVIIKRDVNAIVFVISLLVLIISIVGWSLVYLGMQPYYDVNEVLETPTHVPIQNVHTYSSKVIINHPCVYKARLVGSGSMLPMLKPQTTVLVTSCFEKDDIVVGTVLSYDKPEEDKIIIHRVVYVDDDENGTYYLLKGDNNPVIDDYKIRFEEIISVMVGFLE